MAKKEAPAEVALGTGAGVGKQVAPPDHSKKRAKRTASQQFAEDQLLAAVEAHGNHLHIFPDDWGWKWQWFITPARAAEAACRLAADGVVTVKRRGGAITVDMEARS